jgi:hypothetical protein
MMIYKPLYIYLLYFLFTITLYFFGPVDYVKVNNLELVFLLLMYKFMFIAGYFHSSVKNKKKIGMNCNYISLYKYNSLFYPLFLLFYLLLNIYVYNGVRDFSLSGIITQVLLSVDNPLNAYSNSFSISNRSSFFILIIVLLSPVYYYILMKSIFCFSNLSLLIKFVLLLVFFLEAYKWIAMGRNKGVFDLVILISLGIYCKNLYIKSFETKAKIITKKIKFNRFFITILSFALLVAALAYFDNALTSRKAAYENYNRFDHLFMMKVAPDFMKSLLVNLSIYLAEGYRSLSLIIDLEWDSMYGIGHSSILIDKFSNLLEMPLFDNTYQTKLYVYGIDPYVNWHSAYVWFANDVHWLGVGIIMYLIGYLFSYLWVSFLNEGNVFDLTLLFFVVLMLFYLPGNTQLFNQTATLFSFWVLLVYRLFISRIKVSI